jgi:hypothetical protein
LADALAALTTSRLVCDGERNIQPWCWRGPAQEMGVELGQYCSAPAGCSLSRFRDSEVTALHYTPYGLWNERREALLLWERYLREIIEGA